jgi:hypothetical protein
MVSKIVRYFSLSGFMELPHHSIAHLFSAVNLAFPDVRISFRARKNYRLGVRASKPGKIDPALAAGLEPFDRGRRKPLKRR